MANITAPLHYIDTQTNAPTVLLLHGLGSRSLDWQPQIDALARDYRIIAPDFPGHGNSQALSQPVSMYELAASVAALMQQLSITSVHIVGLSLGGMVAFQLAVSYPELVNTMVIINSAPGPGKLNALQLRMKILTRKALVKLFPLEKLAEKIALDLFPAPSQLNLQQQYLASMEKVDKYTYQQLVNAISHFDLDKEIEQCQTPTLVLSADQDYTSVDFKQRFVKRMCNAHLTVIPNSRHASPLDQPAVCNQAICEFLQKAVT